VRNPFTQIREDGFRDFVSKALRFALFVLHKSTGFKWRSEIIAERSLDEPIHQIKPRISVTIRQATSEDLDKFNGIVNGSKLELLKKRFEIGGRVCFIALDKDKLAYFRWVSLEDEYESSSQLTIKLREREAYLFDAYAVPQYRQGRLHTAVTNEALLYLKDKGYEKALVAVFIHNTYARKALASVGFQGKRVVTLLALFGMKFHRWRKFRGNL